MNIEITKEEAKEIVNLNAIIMAVVSNEIENKKEKDHLLGLGNRIREIIMEHIPELNVVK